MSYKSKSRPFNYKNSKVVTLSTPITFHKKCRYCGGPPTHYYMIRDTPHQLDVADEMDDIFFEKNFIDDLRPYQGSMYSPRIGAVPSSFSKMSSYRPKLHFARGHRFSHTRYRVLTCKCGTTHWYLSNNTDPKMNRPEILHRKSLQYVPIKFEHW